LCRTFFFTIFFFWYFSPLIGRDCHHNCCPSPFRWAQTCLFFLNESNWVIVSVPVQRFSSFAYVPSALTWKADFFSFFLLFFFGLTFSPRPRIAEKLTKNAIYRIHEWSLFYKRLLFFWSTIVFLFSFHLCVCAESWPAGGCRDSPVLDVSEVGFSVYVCHTRKARTLVVVRVGSSSRILLLLL